MEKNESLKLLAPLHGGQEIGEHSVEPLGGNALGAAVLRGSTLLAVQIARSL